MSGNKNRIKILFVYSKLSTFVKNDLEILQKHFDVTPFKYRRKRDDLLKIAWATMKNDLTFSWFAVDYAAYGVFLSKLFKKKSIVIVGGGDVAYNPEIEYGRFTLSWNKRMLTKFALKNANIVLPVSIFTKNEMLDKVKTTNFKIVYNGIDTNKFKPFKVEKEKLIVSIAPVIKKRLKLKGLVTFAKASVDFPDYKFVIIGSVEKLIGDKLKKINQNLIFTNKISHIEVLNWLQRAKIYCQLSYIESFGLANAESMSCCCIPVVTDRGALPEIVGDAGIYVPYGDEKATIDAIKQALNAPDYFGEKARKRIKENFTLEKREEKLEEIIRNLIHK